MSLILLGISGSVVVVDVVGDFIRTGLEGSKVFWWFWCPILKLFHSIKSPLYWSIVTRQGSDWNYPKTKCMIASNSGRVRQAFVMGWDSETPAAPPSVHYNNLVGSVSLSFPDQDRTKPGPDINTSDLITSTYYSYTETETEKDVLCEKCNVVNNIQCCVFCSFLYHYTEREREINHFNLIL